MKSNGQISYRPIVCGAGVCDAAGHRDVSFVCRAFPIEAADVDRLEESRAPVDVCGSVSPRQADHDPGAAGEADRSLFFDTARVARIDQPERAVSLKIEPHAIARGRGFPTKTAAGSSTANHRYSYVIFYSRSIGTPSLMYEARDARHLRSARWNYIASNCHDPMFGVGWTSGNSSPFSRDRQNGPADRNAGGRAFANSCHSYVRRAAGTWARMCFAGGIFTTIADAVFLPASRFDARPDIAIGNHAIHHHDPARQSLTLVAPPPGTLRIAVRRAPCPAGQDMFDNQTV